MKYSLVKRHDPRNPNKDEKWRAAAQSEEVLSLEDLANRMHEHDSKYNYGDLQAVLTTVAMYTAELVQKGYQVDLGYFGKFYATLRSDGTENRKDFRADQHIKEIKANWRPGKPFLNLIEGATFEEVIDRRSEAKLKRAERNGEEEVEIHGQIVRLKK